MWSTKLLISPIIIRIFCPKTTKFGPNLSFLVNLGQAMQAYSVPCWWVGWLLWRAGCISQDTFLLYIFKENVQELCLTKSQGETKARRTSTQDSDSSQTSKQDSNSSQPSTQEGGGGRTGRKSRDIWAAASLPSKDSYCGLCFSFRRFRSKYQI